MPYPSPADEPKIPSAIPALIFLNALGIPVVIAYLIVLWLVM